MSELLDNWLSNNEKETKLAFIEKEILLEKLETVCESRGHGNGGIRGLEA